MHAASRIVLVVIGVALLINFLQGGSGRVTRWTVRTLTGKDLARDRDPVAARAAKRTTARPVRKQPNPHLI